MLYVYCGTYRELYNDKTFFLSVACRFLLFAKENYRLKDRLKTDPSYWVMGGGGGNVIMYDFGVCTGLHQA